MKLDARREVKALLFDKDGTLYDFYQSWSVWAGHLIDRLSDGDAEALSRLSRTLEYDYENKAFHPGALTIAGTVRQQAQVLAAVLPQWSLDRLERYLVTAAATAAMVPAVPLHPLLSRFQAAGLRLGVATNDAESSARRHLEGSDIIDKFEYIVGYDSGYGAKPDPGMCTAFAQAVELDPAQCVMIGDSRHDLVAGRAAGMVTVAVLTGAAAAPELAPLADAVLPDIGALPDWIASQG